MQVSPKLGFNWIISAEGEETDVSPELERSRRRTEEQHGRNYVWCTWHLILIWWFFRPLKAYLEYASCLNAWGLLDCYIKHDLSVPLGLTKDCHSSNIRNSMAKRSHKPFVQVLFSNVISALHNNFLAPRFSRSHSVAHSLARYAGCQFQFPGRHSAPFKTTWLHRVPWSLGTLCSK